MRAWGPTKRVVALVFLCFAILGQPAALAQTSTATLIGTVRDSSGAVLPSVSVTAIETARNTQQAAITNDAGVLTCGDTVEGKRLWQLRLTGPISASPIASGKYLYLVNEKGLAQVVDTSGAEGVIMSELDFGEAMIATPSIANGGLYFRGDGHLWKITKS